MAERKSYEYRGRWVDIIPQGPLFTVQIDGVTLTLDGDPQLFTAAESAEATAKRVIDRESDESLPN